jgi:hypothetical protein
MKFLCFIKKIKDPVKNNINKKLTGFFDGTPMLINKSCVGVLYFCAPR